MKESQHTEWKESWRDDYLRWLCGFANADGGTLIIGRNDEGVAVGATDAERLLVDLPNKIRDTLGIIPPVRAVDAKGKMLVEKSSHLPRPSATGANTTSARAARSSTSRATPCRRSCCASSGAIGTTRRCPGSAFGT